MWVTLAPASSLVAATALAQAPSDVPLDHGRPSSPPPAAVPPGAPATVPQVHDHGGLYVRLIGGPGFAGYEIGGQRSSAVSADLSVAVGGALGRRWILFAELVVNEAPASKQEVDVNGNLTDDTSLGFAGLGPGVAYILPWQTYVAASLGIAQHTLESELEHGRTLTRRSQTGIAGQLSLGRDFWIGPTWGLGAAAKVYYSTTSGGSDFDGEQVSTLGGGIGLSGFWSGREEKAPSLDHAAGGAVPPRAAVRAADAHRHDGLFMRLGFGLGYGHLHLGRSANTVGGTGNLAIGAALSDRLVVYGEAFLGGVVESRFRVEDETGVQLDQAIIRYVGVGPGVSYYTRDNYYAAASLGMTQQFVDLAPLAEDGELIDSKPGIGGTLAAAREWWVSDQLAVGVSLGLSFSVNKLGAEANDQTLSTLAATIGFTSSLD